MGTVTFPLSEKLKERMTKHKEIKWGKVAAQAIEQKLDLVEKLDKVLSKSTFTEKDALLLGRKANRAIAQKY